MARTHPRRNLTGAQFDRLTVIEFNHIDKWNRSVWRCKCICGRTKLAATQDLSSGNTRSCGCLTAERGVV